MDARRSHISCRTSLLPDSLGFARSRPRALRVYAGPATLQPLALHALTTIPSSLAIGREASAVHGAVHGERGARRAAQAGGGSLERLASRQLVRPSGLARGRLAQGTLAWDTATRS